MKEAGVGFEDIAIPLSDTRNEDQKSVSSIIPSNTSVLF